MKFGRNVLHVNKHPLTTRIFDLTSHFTDGGHDAISRIKVLPTGECSRSVCRRLCSSVRQFLNDIHPTAKVSEPIMNRKCP